MFSDGSKKSVWDKLVSLIRSQPKWVKVVGGSVVTVVILLFFFVPSKYWLPSSDDPSNPTPSQDQDDGGGIANPWGDLDYQLPEQEINPDQLEKVYIGKATSIVGGTVASFSEKGSYGEVLLEYGDDEDRKTHVLGMTIDSKVFNTKNNLIMTPSSLTSLPEGTLTEAYVSGRSVEDRVVEAIIVNPVPDLYYSHISELREDENNAFIVNNESGMVYVYPKDKPPVNALTGAIYDLSRVKVSDKVFMYDSGEVGTPTSVPEDLRDKTPIYVKELYVYPSNENF